jgi:hypothetical protein
MVSPRILPLPLVAVCLALVTTTCSSSSDGTVATPSSTGSAPTSSPSTSVAASSSTNATPSLDPTTTTGPGVAFSVYWTRPFGDPRPIDMPGYRDGEDGSHPYVLFGAVTNTSDRTIESPRVTVEWRVGGRTIHDAIVPVQDPSGGPSAALEPGASGDLVVVVADDAVAGALSDADPQFSMVAS